MRKLEYTLRRLLLSLGVLIGMTIVTFVLTRVVPSNPAALYLGQRARPEQIEAITQELGLDDPLPVQYIRYMNDLLHGDLGDSLATKRPVTKEILSRIPATAELLVTAIVIAISVGIPLGVFSAQLHGKPADVGVRTVSIIGVSIPQFWLGLILQLVFGLWVGLFPIAGRVDSTLRFSSPIEDITGLFVLDTFITGNWIAFKDVSLHLILPAITLAAYPIGLIARMTRATMIEVLGQNYIRTAEAYGIARRMIVYVYALKNAIIPTLTVIGLTFAYSLTGAFYVEIIFNWPGLGLFTARSFLNLDFPAIMGITLFGATGYIIINLLIDLLQAYLDPRVSLD
ncbi:MAG: ABC transporter permease [Anaerolineae bacterium]|nr:ABC transporter permease [Anaerolineae bacterium]